MSRGLAALCVNVILLGMVAALLYLYSDRPDTFVYALLFGVTTAVTVVGVQLTMCCCGVAKAKAEPIYGGVLGGGLVLTGVYLVVHDGLVGSVGAWSPIVLGGCVLVGLSLLARPPPAVDAVAV